MKKRLMAIILTGAMLVPAVSMAESADSAKAKLVDNIAETAECYAVTGDNDLSIYRGMDWNSIGDTLPSSFDLRDRGVVPEIRSQGNWGTCWGFASIAAAETSILSSLGMTTKEFLENYGIEMNLSERHLAWFGTSHLPTLDDYAEGEYPYEENQAGEGIWHDNDDTDPSRAHYNAGGYMGYASSIFANGMGPQLESDYPYEANDGSDSTAADWSLSEDARYGFVAQLKNSAILPSPSQRDENGNYVYNIAGTEAIKQELMAGRGVSIIYQADQSMSPEAELEMQLTTSGCPLEAAQVYINVFNGKLSPENMTDEEKLLFMHAYMIFCGMQKSMITEDYLQQCTEDYFDEIIESMFGSSGLNDEVEDEEDVSTDESVQRAAAAKLGNDYDEYLNVPAKQSTAVRESYLNTDTYAQYTDTTNTVSNHAVCIVGWDDDYAVSNFPDDHQPPAAGAWIVRNSWGGSYGIGGYFYLSYYDQSIAFAESFEFIFDEDANNGVSITAYDNMQASSIASVQTEDPVFLANVFNLDEESILSYVSVMTADLNAKVTVGVYLLNENSTSPIDGILLDSVTQDFEFGGYHRIALNYSYQLPAGSRISVVERQRTETVDGLRYTLPYTNGLSESAVQGAAALDEDDSEEESDYQNISWTVGCIGEGESFICVGNEWYDWKDIVEEVTATNAVTGLATFDNLNIKAYLYTTDGVYAAHDFSTSRHFGGNDALICDDCGEMLIVIDE